MSTSDPGNRRPKLNRRQSLQLGAAATAAGLLGAEEMAAPAQAASGSGGGDPSFARGGYPTPPFVDALPEYNLPQFVAQPVLLSSLKPPPGKNAVVGEARRDPHPAWETHPPQKYYEIFIEENKQVKLHRDLPFNTMWGFRDGGNPQGTPLVPGPTFHVKVGEPILVRIWNKLPPPSQHVGYGKPEVTIHLHDNHNTPESDGNADDYFPKLGELDPAHNDPGRFKDYHWINQPAGNDPNETMGTLWYHDHRHGFTAANTYKGLVGFYLVFDDIDNDDETSRVPGHLALPSGKYDVPMVLADKLIDSSGHLVFDQLEMDGILGNRITVNGKIQPFFEVEPRQYRFRVLNAGPSRVYGISIKVASNAVGDLRGATDYPHVFFIGQAGTLFTQALPFVGPGIRVPAQRVVVIIDFSHVKSGQTVYAVNEFAQSSGNKPDNFIGNTVNGPQFRAVLPGLPITRFDVNRPATNPPDPSTPIRQFLPTALGGDGRILREVPAIPAGVNALSEAAILAAVGKKYPFASAPEVATVRDWRFERTNGQWAINNRLYDGEHPAALCKQNTTELWIFRNNSGGWVHPIHTHFEKFRTLYRANGLKPGPLDPQFGREDTLALGPGERAVIFMHFRDFTGKYLMHCHNTVHEDHAMMVRWDIVK